MSILGQRFRNDHLKVYQIQLRDMLREVFDSEDVYEEWSAMRDEYGLSIYCPRLDVAVGPFATHERLGHTYDDMLTNPIVESFLRKLVECNKVNLERYADGFVRPSKYEEILFTNHNARCFMSIEIEHMVSRKHLIGGAVNASALGRFGIIMPWSDEKLRAFVKLIRYFQYLKYAEKNTFDTSNLLIVTKEQMDNAIIEILNQKNQNKIQ
ncbi:hypothetical protein [Paenibacillus amylolyticus]|uniref:hypothetical protein n=1 Tax=Paenibacillus amylolyticus TaxID=1451 RepID=UPI00344FEF45